MPDFTPTISARFVYHGVVRHVDNLKLEHDYTTLIGMERRRSGKYSHHIKRYKTAQISDLLFFNPPNGRSA